MRHYPIISGDPITPSRVRSKIDSLRGIVAAYRLPVARLSGGSPRLTESWTRIYGTVAANMTELFSAAETAYSAGDMPAANDIISRAEQRWRRWLRQVERTPSGTRAADETMIGRNAIRTNDAFAEYAADAIEDLQDARDALAPWGAGAGIALIAIGGLGLYVLSKR